MAQNFSTLWFTSGGQVSMGGCLDSSIIGMPIPTRIPILCSFTRQFSFPPSALFSHCICFVIKQSWGFKASVWMWEWPELNWEQQKRRMWIANCRSPLFGVYWTRSRCKSNVPLIDHWRSPKETVGGHSSGRAKWLTWKHLKGIYIKGIFPNQEEKKKEFHM